jgi:hypothetical protein
MNTERARKERSLRLVTLGCTVSASGHLSHQEREEIYEAMMELASIIDPPAPIPTTANPDDFFAALDFLSGPDDGKTVSKRWSYPKDAAFRKIVQRNRALCEAMIKLRGTARCREYISKYRDGMEEIAAIAIEQDARRRLLAMLQQFAMIDVL